MSKFSISKIKAGFSKEARQKRQEMRLTKIEEKEREKYERYLALSTEDKRIADLKKKIADYRSGRGAKKRTVKIGGHTFSI